MFHHTILGGVRGPNPLNLEIDSEDFSQLRLCGSPPSPFRSDHIFMKDTESAEPNEKSIFIQQSDTLTTRTLGPHA